MLPPGPLSDAVLASYSAIAATQRLRDLEETALRSRSTALRDLLAHLASDGRNRYADIMQMSAHQLDELDARWASALARVVAFQSTRDDDYDVAIRILTSSTARMPERTRLPYRRVLAEILYASGNIVAYERLLDTDTSLHSMGDGYLVTDMHNPFTGSPYADHAQWLAGFERRFTHHGLEAPQLRGEASVAFDRLGAGTTRAIDAEPLISVVMTRYGTPREPLLTSVRSILDQSWRNLELIVVDDCSPADSESVLEELETLDDRIHVVRMRENGGTYLARNAGIRAARGALITGQDDDDWSHPERIARQAAPLLKDASVPATRSRCITVNDQLVMQRPGYDPVRPNASSLMFRTESARAVGGFLPSRRGADSEFHLRLELLYGRPAVDLTEPLALVRIRTDSLSRSDFRPGWHHPARRAFRSAFVRWHATANKEQLSTRRANVPIPERFAVHPRPLAPFDVVVVADWRLNTDPVRRMITAIDGAPESVRIGVLQLDSPRFLSRRNEPLSSAVQDFINAGRVTRVLDDESAQTKLIVVADPDVLQFPPDEPFALDGTHLLVVADHAPARVGHPEGRYDARSCSTHARHLFGRTPTWIATRSHVRDALDQTLDETLISNFTLGPGLDVQQWMTDRVGRRADRPVIGHHATDGPHSWPTETDFDLVYPCNDRLEIRRLGSAQWALHVLRVRELPPNWVMFDTADIDVRTFLSSLDFFVYYPSKGTGPRGSQHAIIEALAAGCVPVLPPDFRAIYGNAAVYASPASVGEVVHSLYEDRAAYTEAARRASDWVTRANHSDSHIPLTSLLTPGPWLHSAGERQGD